MSYELTGTVTHIFDAMEFESGFKKREFVVKTDDKYPQDVGDTVLKGLSNAKLRSRRNTDLCKATGAKCSAPDSLSASVSSSQKGC
jgi:hypothetical protein